MPKKTLPKKDERDSWDDYRLLVIHNLDEINKNIKIMQAKIDKNYRDVDKRLDVHVLVNEKEHANIKTEVTKLKVKAGIFGAVWGLLSAVGIWIIKSISG